MKVGQRTKRVLSNKGTWDFRNVKGELEIKVRGSNVYWEKILYSECASHWNIKWSWLLWNFLNEWDSFLAVRISGKHGMYCDLYIGVCSCSTSCLWNSSFYGIYNTLFILQNLFLKVHLILFCFFVFLC